MLSRDLERQLWLARSDDPPTPENFTAPYMEKFPRAKPRGGMWTSTWLEEHGSWWVQWCLSEEFDCDRNDRTWNFCWLLTPAADARIYTIDTLADLERLIASHPAPENDYSYEREFPDWVKVAQDFDAVHLTEEGQWATRMSHPANLYGWDCESTLWLRWAFASVESIGRQTFRALDPWWEEAAV